MSEHLVTRIAPQANSGEPAYYAKLNSAAWAIPATDALANNAPNTNFNADVGIMGVEGLTVVVANVEVAFFLGMCKGVFYREEVVRVIRWPFTGQPPGHNYQWMAIGSGMSTPWATPGGQGWAIQAGETIGGGQPMPAHEIEILPDDQFAPGPDAFPGRVAPLAFTEVTLTNKPAQFKWCGAEGVFYPIVQAPTGTGVPPPPPGGDPMLLGDGGMVLGDGGMVLGG